MVFTQAQLKILVEHRCRHAGITPGVLANRIYGESNRKALARLMAGHGISATSAERASAWMLETWPPETPWPEEVPRPRRGRRITSRRQAEECAR